METQNFYLARWLIFFLLLYLCISFEKVPSEEADILSKLLAEVARDSVPYHFQEPASKVSGGC